MTYRQDQDCVQLYAATLCEEKQADMMQVKDVERRVLVTTCFLVKTIDMVELQAALMMTECPTTILR